MSYALQIAIGLFIVIAVTVGMVHLLHQDPKGPAAPPAPQAPTRPDPENSRQQLNARRVSYEWFGEPTVSSQLFVQRRNAEERARGRAEELERAELQKKLLL